MKLTTTGTDVRVDITVTPELSARINRASGQGGRGRFIRAAIMRELERVELNEVKP